MTCPPEPLIHAYLGASLDEPSAVAFEQHLEDCPHCLRKVAAHQPADEEFNWLELLQHPYPETAIDNATATMSEIVGVTSFPPLLSDGGARYQFVRPVGSGGAGVVWEGQDLLLQRSVAIKLLRTEKSSLQETQRLLQEAAALGRLSHPHIVQVHEVQCQGTQPALIMEFVAGPTLAAALQGQPCSASFAARFAVQLADAMIHAHKHGVIHRDLKPSNILLQPLDGTQQTTGRLRPDPDRCTPKIADFGLAKILDQHSLTLSGQQLGTPSYMAPEQISAVSGSAGPPLDIYGLGAVLYELLTGRPPFTSSDPALTMAMILRDEPVAPSTLVRGTPRDLETICLKCLAKKPIDRYASATALHADLVAFLEHRPIIARPVSRPARLMRWVGRHRFESASIGIIASLLMGLSVGALQYAAIAKQTSEAQQKASAAELGRVRDRESRNKQLRLKFIELLQTHKRVLAAVGDRNSQRVPEADVLGPELALAAARVSSDYLSLLEQNLKYGEHPDENELWAVIESLDIAHTAGISEELDSQLVLFEKNLPQYVATIPLEIQRLELLIRLKNIRARHEGLRLRYSECGTCYMQMADLIQRQVELLKAENADYRPRLSVMVSMLQNARSAFAAGGLLTDALDAVRLAERSCNEMILTEPKNDDWMLRWLECRWRQAELLPPAEAAKLIEGALQQLRQHQWRSPEGRQQADSLKDALSAFQASLPAAL